MYPIYIQHPGATVPKRRSFRRAIFLRRREMEYGITELRVGGNT